MQVDRLLEPEVSDVDGNTEERRGTVSVFNGPAPILQILDSIEAEGKTVGAWLSNHGNQGLVPHEMGVFVRSAAELTGLGWQSNLPGSPSSARRES